MLSIRNLTKSYRSAGEQVTVLRGLDLAIAAGESVALTGESGSGKSTLLHLIAGLDQADDGEIRLGETLVSGLSDAGRAALRRDRDARVIAERLAAASDGAREVAGRANFGDRAVERRAGAEPAGRLQLRPRGGDVRRRADGDAGRPRGCDVSATALCQSAPRRLA